MMTDDELEKYVREKAAKGWSRVMCYGALGISAPKFEMIIAGYEGLEWAGNNKSFARQERYAEQRGRCTPGLLYSVECARLARTLPPKIYKIGTTEGQLHEIHGIWKEYIDVTISGVKQRIKRGWNIYDAFFSKQKTRKK